MISRRTIKITLAHLVPQSLYVYINARIAARDIATKRRWVPELEELPKFVRPGDSVLDIGANHGLYSYHLSHLVGPSGTVHAFEPLPANIRILRHTCKVHNLGNVILYALGCGDAAQRTEFSVRTDNGIPLFGCARQGGEGQTFVCEVVRLDDVIDTKISFMKIDVEEAELFVLRGAERLLRESRPTIQFEAEGLTRDLGYEQQRVFDFLRTFGYAFFGGASKGCALEPRESFTAVGDYFAVAE